jgi:hypothetical protein
MLKHIGLSICLCLMAMGLNSILVTRSDAQQRPTQEAKGVTNGATARVPNARQILWGYTVNRFVQTICDEMKHGDAAQGTRL